MLKTRLGCLERLAPRGQRSKERRERMAREGETRLHSQSREGGCLLTTSANATDKKGGGQRPKNLISSGWHPKIFRTKNA